MTLRQTASASPLSYEERVKQYKADIERLETEYRTLGQDLMNQKMAYHELVFNHETGFEVGDTVLYPVPSGRSTKEKTCVIELEEDTFEGVFYVRPLNEDGTKSGRHFRLSRDNYNLLKEVT